jgi:hypothetical protein
MVERMTSVEIEDVLSSIRRLVTDDLRPKSAALDTKLILTPALRVVPDVAELPLDVDLDADLTAALWGDDAPDSTEGAAAVADFPMFLHQDRRVENVLPAAAPEMSETVSHIAAAIPADGYEAELGDVMAVPEWPESSWVAPEVIDGVEEAELIALALQDAPHDDWVPEPPFAMPDAADDADAAADAAEAAALAALAALEGQAALTEIDEDMLRDIVRDMIREELQGTLGERITRNVRKLVRAEINRALMTQDLD